MSLALWTTHHATSARVGRVQDLSRCQGLAQEARRTGRRDQRGASIFTAIVCGTVLWRRVKIDRDLLGGFCDSWSWECVGAWTTRPTRILGADVRDGAGAGSKRVVF